MDTLIDKLTPRQVAVLATYVQVGDRKKVGELLFISPHTVARHLEDVYRKLEANNALSAANKLGWITTPEIIDR